MTTSGWTQAASTDWRPLRHVSAAAAAVLTVAAAAISFNAPAWPTAFEVPPPPPACIGRSVFDLQTVRIADRYAHASSAVALRDGRLRAVWYEGTKELAPDVKLWTATYDGTRWSDARPILNAAQVAEGIGRYVRKLGNAIIFRDAEGQLVILFAALSIGGWDGANLKLISSSDEGETWSPPRNLTTSATFNFATNVRGPAVAARDGLTLVPTSHEFVQSFPAVVLLDRHGRVVGKRRIGTRFRGLQPFVSVADEHRAVAFMRVREGYTLVAKTDDTGNSWSVPAQTNSPNPDSPVVVTRIGETLLMVSSEYDPAAGTWRLAFALSHDGGQSWQTIYRKSFGTDRQIRARYPWLILGPDGLYHVLFTYSHADGRSDLMDARWSRDWIAGQGGPPCP